MADKNTEAPACRVQSTEAEAEAEQQEAEQQRQGNKDGGEVTESKGGGGRFLVR